jgi:hypothetical protein
MGCLTRLKTDVRGDIRWAWIRIQWGPWSRIRIHGFRSRFRRAKMTHKNVKKLIKFIFEVLDVLFSGLKASPVARTSFKEA